MKGGEDLMNLEIATGNYKSEKCKCLCAVFEKRGIRELPNKSASHFLSGDFVLQNAYLANVEQRIRSKKCIMWQKVHHNCHRQVNAGATGDL